MYVYTMNTESIAQDIASDRRGDIDDIKDVAWYVSEVSAQLGLAEWQEDEVTARVAAILSI